MSGDDTRHDSDVIIPGYEFRHLLDRIADLKAKQAALLNLMLTDECFVSNNPRLAVVVNINNYGADGEEIPESEWIAVSALVDEFGTEACQAWAAWRRNPLATDTPKPGLGVLGKECLAKLKLQEQ